MHSCHIFEADSFPHLAIHNGETSHFQLIKSTESAFPSCHPSQTENIPQDGQAHGRHPQGVEGISKESRPLVGNWNPVLAFDIQLILGCSKLLFKFVNVCHLHSVHQCQPLGAESRGT